MFYPTIKVYTWMLNGSFFKCISSLSLSSIVLIFDVEILRSFLSSQTTSNWNSLSWLIRINFCSAVRIIFFITMDCRRMKTGAEQKIRWYHFLCFFFHLHRLPSVADKVNKHYIACWLNNNHIVSGDYCYRLRMLIRTIVHVTYIYIHTYKYNNVA